MKFLELHSRFSLVIYFIHTLNSVYLSVPIFQIHATPCFPLWYPSICSLCLCLYFYFVNLLLFHSVAKSCLTLGDPMDCSMPGFPVLPYLLEFSQSHVHYVGDAIQPPYPLSPPFPSALDLSQYQGLFQWVSSWHQMVKVLELQLQHQSFQWIFRVDFL